ncbi:MAG: hypothetical protein QXG03_06360 [Halalkalicoccus sp.]
MSEDNGGDTVRCWLVERTYDDKGLIRLVYAPTDGAGQFVTERAAAAGVDATAGIEVDPEKLEPIAPENEERYASEAERMAGRHEPDERI